MGILGWFKAGRIAVIVLLIACAAIYREPWITHGFASNFSFVSQALIGLSISLILFPFISVPVVHSVVTRAWELGIEPSKELVKDYVDACFTVFVLSTVEMICVIMYSLSHWITLVYIMLPVLVAMIMVLLILSFGLWKVAALLYTINGKRNSG